MTDTAFPSGPLTPLEPSEIPRKRLVTLWEGIWGVFIATATIAGWVYHFSQRVDHLEWSDASQNHIIDKLTSDSERQQDLISSMRTDVAEIKRDMKWLVEQQKGK